MKKENNKILAQEWFKKADEDLAYAKVGFKETAYYGLACFHCQQVVEKYLKGYLSFSGRPVRKIHLLRILISQCIKLNKEFEKFKASCNLLDTYYISSRYPVIPITYSKEEAQKAIIVAEEIIDFIVQKTEG